MICPDFPILLSLSQIMNHPPPSPPSTPDPPPTLSGWRHARASAAKGEDIDVVAWKAASNLIFIKGTSGGLHLSHPTLVTDQRDQTAQTIFRQMPGFNCKRTVAKTILQRLLTSQAFWASRCSNQSFIVRIIGIWN